VRFILPRGVPPSDTFASHPCSCGVSTWHYLALGMVHPEEASRFLLSTLSATGPQLFHDLLDHTTVPLFGMHGFTFDVPDRAPSYIGYSVEQICRVKGQSLLENYAAYGSANWPMHELVRSFDKWLAEVIKADKAGRGR